VRRNLELDPTDQEVYRLAGDILRARGKCAGAVPFYERALLLNRVDTESARGLGDCYLKTDRFTGAIDVLRKALSREPKNAELRRLLAEALVRTRNFSQAEAVVRVSLEQNPGDAGSHFQMALIRAGLGDAAGARKECEKVLQIAPGDEQAKKLLDSLP
jgi:Flp pilus assembly protein TadD